MRADSFKIFITKILACPLWVKQILFFALKNDLKKILSNHSLNIPENDIFQAYKPQITYAGKVEIENHNNYHEEVMYTFLKSIRDNKNIIDTTLDCFLTLEETSKLFVEALKNQYIMPPESTVVDGTARFLSGEIKTGEYLLKIGRLTVDQLDVAIRQQKKSEEEGRKCYMAEILSGLGFIEKDEIISILIMKEEAKRRFIFNMELNTGEVESLDSMEMKKKIERLAYENNYLKTKLKALLKIGN